MKNHAQFRIDYLPPNFEKAEKLIVISSIIHRSKDFFIHAEEIETLGQF
jgi:hypothetical protein